MVGCPLVRLEDRALIAGVRRWKGSSRSHYGLAPEMFQRMAHRLAGDLDQSAERLVQFEEQEDRGAHGHRRRHERRNRGAVARRDEAEAAEKVLEPENNCYQERVSKSS